jgi:isopenicillin-N epimerase
MLPPRPNLRSEFLLRPDIIPLNHGSFGAPPKVVFDAQTDWRQRIEADPIEILGRRGTELIHAAKTSIGSWLGMKPADFGMVTNATEGINCVLRSLDFKVGDELLTTSHVYNAVRQAMKYTAQKAGATYREIEIPLPINSPAQIESAVMQAVTAKTKLLVIDHISSPTAIIFPVERIITACKKISVDVLVDGAHAPGMLALNVSELSPTYYAGNLHKWACGPKGSAFLWVAPERQALIHLLIVSHHLGQGMTREFSWQGTRDISAWLATPRAIELLSEIGWEKIRAYNHALAVWTNQMLCEKWKVQSISPLDGSMLGSMATVPLPPPLDQLSESGSANLQRKLHDDYRIEVPIMRWGGKCYLRPCCQIYNVADEYLGLADVVAGAAGRL